MIISTDNNQSQKWRLILLFSWLLALPAQAGEEVRALSGQVSLFSQAGKPIEDCSGVVVFVEEVGHNRGFKPARPAQMVSRDMQFTPEILPVVAGTTVVFPNEDDMFHNVYSLSKTKPFDLGLYKGGEEKSVVFDRPGLVRVYCNIHEGMRGFILVLGNPYFAVTDKEGRFSIPGLPYGTYDLVAWHRYGGGASKEVVVTAGKKVKVSSQLAEDGKIKFKIIETNKTASHKDKWGSDYKSNY